MTDLSLPGAAGPGRLPAVVLGVAGLIPFVSLSFGAMAGLGGEPGMIARLLVTYGAIILSFLGGVQWGFAAADGVSHKPLSACRRYGASVASSLLAWVALSTDAKTALTILALGHAAVVIYDVATARLGEAPRWYGRLRIVLGTGALICLGLPAVMVDLI